MLTHINTLVELCVFHYIWCVGRAFSYFIFCAIHYFILSYYFEALLDVTTSLWVSALDPSYQLSTQLSCHSPGSSILFWQLYNNVHIPSFPDVHYVSMNASVAYLLSLCIILLVSSTFYVSF